MPNKAGLIALAHHRTPTAAQYHSSMPNKAGLIALAQQRLTGGPLLLLSTLIYAQ